MPVNSRKQSERNAATRAALIDATVDLIQEYGLQGTNVLEICKRAGVTTGAIQHQFGSKNGLIAEVVKALFKAFTRTITTEVSCQSLSERVQALVDHYWSIYEDDRYYAVAEILLATRHDTELMGIVSRFRDQQLSALMQTAPALFPDVHLTPDEFRIVVHRMLDYLRGHSIRRIYESSHLVDATACAYAHDMLMREFSKHLGGTSHDP